MEKVQGDQLYYILLYCWFVTQEPLLASFTLSGSAFQWFTTLVLKKFLLISVFAEAGTRLNLELDCLVDLDAVSAALVNQLPSSYTWPCVSGTL